MANGDHSLPARLSSLGLSTNALSEMIAGIVSIAADAIISIDDTQNIMLFNDGAEVIFGYGRDEVIGRPLSMLLPDEHQSAHGRHVVEFGFGTVASRRMGERREIKGRRKTGETFPAEASISKLVVGGRKIYTAVLRDASERREAARQLEYGKRVLEIALELGQVGIFEYDHALDAAYWSPLLRHHLGVSADAVGGIETLRQRLHLDDRARVDAEIAHAQDPQSDGFLTSEHRIVRQDGVVRWMAVRAHTSFADGRPSRTIGAVLDITDRRDTQAALEARINEATSDLRLEMQRRETSQAQLVQAQRMEAFGQLTGGIAHDFNNLLTVITGNLELLEMRLEDERQKVLLTRAKDAAAMGARLTGRLLTFARRRQTASIPLDINDQVIAMAELLERTLGPTITLTKNLEHSVWPVLADPSEIENAILNLAINARDSMPGGGTLMIETANVDIREPDSRLDVPPGAYVRLTVSDNGSGMSEDVVRHAFEPFFTTKETGRGTGLGLATIYGFARQAKGTVMIHSVPGCGTTVRIYLPRTDAVIPVSQSGPTQDGLPAVTGYRVLLVEDNPDVRRVTREELETLGYTVIESDCGQQAVAQISSAAGFDIVLSDVAMPGGMSGFDVANWLHANAPRMKLVLVSGNPDGEIDKAVDAHVQVEVLRKPFSRAELARALLRAKTVSQAFRTGAANT